MYVILGVILLLILFPLFYLVRTSLLPAALLFKKPPEYLFKPTLRYYTKVFVEENYFQFYLNSLIIGLFSTGGTLILGVFGAFAVTKLKFRGANLLMFIVLLTWAYMPMTTGMPIFLVGKYLGLLDTRLWLILVYTAGKLPLGMFILVSFFKEIPEEIYDSAEIDGCGIFSLFYRITMPLSSVGLVAAAVLIFLYNWNEFLWALLLTSFDARTAPVALTAYKESETVLHWGELSSLGFCMTFPVLFFMLFFKKYLVKGLLLGAVKG